jgi:O-antigen ligase
MNIYFLIEKNEVKRKINLVLYFLILAYIISLFLKDMPVITNVLMAFICLLSILSVSPANYLKQLSTDKISLGIVLFYLYQVISVLLSQDIQSGLAVLILRLPLLILPLSFCFIDFEKKIWDKILLFYAVTTTIASIIGFLFGVYRSIVEHDTGFLYNDNISVYIGKQSVYFAYYVAVAIIIFVVQLKEYPEAIQKYRPLIYFSIAWLLFIIFMLASRTTMFALLFVLTSYILVAIIRKRKFLEGMLLFFSLIIGVVIISKFFPKTLNRFKGTTEINYQFDNKNVENHFNAAYDSTKWNGTNTRAAIWHCAIEVWKEEPVFGTGLGDRTNALIKKYEENNFWYGFTTRKNTHSQYLDILLSMGVVGLLIFIITFFIFPIRKLIQQKNLFAVIVFALLACCFLTETMFDRYQGLIFIAFILPLSSKVAKSF